MELHRFPMLYGYPSVWRQDAAGQHEPRSTLMHRHLPFRSASGAWHQPHPHPELKLPTALLTGCSTRSLHQTEELGHHRPRWLLHGLSGQPSCLRKVAMV